MKFDPTEYTCPEHHRDLTGQVERALEEDGPPVAYWRRSVLGKAAGPRRFEVLVTCPGTGQAHQLACTGTCTR